MRVLKIWIVVLLLLTNTAMAGYENRPIKVTLQSSTITLDPGGIQDTQSILVSRQINCQLFRNEGSTFAFDAAESVKYVSPVKIVLKINKNTRFHDGSRITSLDVLASFNYIKNTRSVFTNLFHWINKIDAIDDNTLAIYLKKPVPEFLSVLSSTNYSIYKHTFLEKAAKNKTLWKYPEGCGGYRVSEYGDHLIRLSPISKGLPIEFVLNPKNQITVDEASKYDIVTLHVVDQQGELQSFKKVNMFDPTQYYIGLNSQGRNWHSKVDRCQFLSGLNINQLVSRYGSSGVVAKDLIPRDTLGYDENSKFKEKIDALAGHGSNKNFRENHHQFCFAYLTVSVQAKHKNDYLDMVNQVIPISEIQPIANVGHFGENFVKSGCDAIFFGLGSNYFDGYEFLTVYEDNDANFTGIRDERLSGQIKKSQMLGDADQRAKMYRKIINKIANTCTVMPLFTVTMRSIYVKDNIKAPGIGLVSFDQYYLGNLTRS